MNYIILFATGYILKIEIKHIRLIISALLGGIYSVAAYLQILEIYSNILLKIILSIVMVYIAYNSKNIKQIIKQLLFFYLITFVFGGCAFALLYFIKPEQILMRNGVYIGTYPLKIVILGGIVGFTLTVIAFKYAKMKINKKNMFCELEIYFENKKINTIALIDTGNMLKDPITSMPVIVVEKSILKNVLPDIIIDNLNKIIGGDVPKEVYEDKNLNYITKFRVIPFSSIGKENGLLLGFKSNKIKISTQEEGQKVIENVIVGIYDHSLSKKNNYFALVGFEILEKS
jgi:sigma-E processing peptidase SpoIIGA